MSQACTSQFVVKTLYGKMDDSFAKYIKDVAEFDAAQQIVIDDAAAEFAQWHQTTQLPQYQLFVNDIKPQFASTVSEADMERIALQVERFGDAMAAQPWQALRPLMSSLTPLQIEQIAESLEKESVDDEKKLENKLKKRNPDNPYRDVLKNVRKTFKRVFAVTLSDDQMTPFRSAVERSAELQSQEIALYRTWNARFIRLLKQVDSEQKETALLEHLLSGTHLLRTHYPEEVAKNRRLFLEAFRLTLNSLSDQQRELMIERLDFYSELIEELAESR